ncbi:MAG: hypothetical protein V7689_11400, partial [Psychrobacter sp.]
MRLLPPVTTPQSAVPILTHLSDTQLAKNAPLPLTPQTPYSQLNVEPINDSDQSDTLIRTRYPTLTDAPLSKSQSDALAAELNALYKSVMDSLGSKDARYIQRIYATVVYSEVIARGLLAVAGRMPSKC